MKKDKKINVKLKDEHVEHGEGTCSFFLSI